MAANLGTASDSAFGEGMEKARRPEKVTRAVWDMYIHT